MPNFRVNYHPKFFKDLKGLSKIQLIEVNKRVEKIKANPEYFKDLSGKNNCHTIRIENMRLVYYFDGSNLWFLILDNRGSVYEEYVKRLYSMRVKFMQ